MIFLMNMHNLELSRKEVCLMEQLSLFEQSERKLPAFSCVLCDEAFNLMLNTDRTLTSVDAELTIEEFKLFATNSPTVKRSQFGYTTFGYIGEKPVELFIRFGNETTRTKESVYDYIERAFPIEELFHYDYEEFKKLKRF